MFLSKGGIRLFRVAGIDVYLHWLWFAIAIIAIQYQGRYSSYLWSAAEYVTLFLIVLMHEFGHALACRSVGGKADRIMLWPLGGMTFASPPPRPGAVLWTTAAGPLVHVLLAPFLVGLWFFGGSLGLKASQPDLQQYLLYMMLINGGLLVINILPIYPLDGGQMLRALLWFAMGPVRSLQVVSVLGFVGGGGVVLLAIVLQDPLMGFFAGYMLLTCLGGLTQARLLARAASGPRRGGFSCPSCGAAPPVGPYWGCGKCRKTFDTFETRAVCPHCGAPFAVTSCISCGSASPIGQWIVLEPSATSTSE